MALGGLSHFMDGHACTCMYVCVCVDHGWPSNLGFDLGLLIVLLCTQLIRLARGLQESRCICLLSADITSRHHHTWLSYEGSGH